MRNFLVISLLIAVCASYAQNSLSPIVIGSQGSAVSSSSGKEVQYTVGESVILTSSSTDHLLTQGFNQPNSLLANTLLDVYYTVHDASCFGILDGYILLDSIVGCDGNYTITFDGSAVNISDTLSGLGSGDHFLDISSTDGCTFSETITIDNLGEDCDLAFYNAFSPNGDLVNDLWIIDKVEGFPDNIISIYDRWGVLVWEGTGYDNVNIVWDGKNKNGTDLPDGTYFYIFQSNDLIIKNYVEITR